MSVDDENEEITSDDTANTPIDSKVLVPLEVKVINPEVKVKNWYDSVDDDEYDYLGVTKEDLDEFEKDGDSSGK